MRKVIAAINMTLDGYCDHTAMVADEEVHDHYTDLLNSGGAMLYGRITYKLMEDYWPTLVKKPSGEKSMDDFANSIHRIPKIVFSRTLKKLEWDTARIAKRGIKEEVDELKKEEGKPILVGSPSLIVACFQLGLVDEFQINIGPTIVGSGLQLFKNIKHRIDLKLIKTKPFGCGSVIHYYEVQR